MIRSILLVDDDNSDAELFEEALQEVDASVTFTYAVDGCHALEILEESPDVPDFIFLDINMPRMNGWECLGKLKGKAEYKDIPVIMYTTSSQQKEKDIATKLGAINFISKPSNFNELKAILKTVIG